MSDKRLVRNNSPETSREALAQHEQSGNRETHLRIVLECVRENPGLTATQLCELLPLGEYQVRRRLTDLRNQELIRRGDEVRCPIRGTLMVTWFPIEPKPVQRTLFE